MKPQFDNLDDRKLLSFATIDLNTGVTTPTPLVTAAEQEAALAVVNEIDRAVKAGDTSVWWAHLHPLDPEFIPTILDGLGIPDPFGPTEVFEMPTYTREPVVPFPQEPYPWKGSDPAPVGYSPWTGQLDPMMRLEYNMDSTKPIFQNEPN